LPPTAYRKTCRKDAAGSQKASGHELFRHLAGQSGGPIGLPRVLIQSRSTTLTALLHKCHRCAAKELDGHVVQERDGLGDRLPPDYLTHVEKGAFYGWPYAYIGQHPQAGFAQLRPDKVKASLTPDLLFEACPRSMSAP
jgi:hypothetical protein